MRCRERHMDWNYQLETCFADNAAYLSLNAFMTLSTYDIS
jgi:hypothetical protein